MSSEKLCRLCLKMSRAYLDLFEGHYTQILQQLTSLEISETDGFPNVACINCVYEIKQAANTRNRILQCHEKLVLSGITNESNIINSQTSVISGESDKIASEINHINVEDASSRIHHDQVFEETCNYFYSPNAESAIPVVELLKKTLQAAQGHPFEVQENLTLVCKDCGKQFTRKGVLNVSTNHEKPICNRCGGSGILLYFGETDEHSNIHVQEKPKGTLQEPLKNEANSRSLLSNIHNKDKNSFRCKNCSCAFSSASLLKEHNENKHKDSSELISKDVNIPSEPVAPSTQLRRKLCASCKFPYCQNGYYRSLPEGVQNIRFFRFPKDLARLETWKKICKIGPDVNCTNFRICEDHFISSDYNNREEQRNLNFQAIPKPSSECKISTDHNYTTKLL